MRATCNCGIVQARGGPDRNHVERQFRIPFRFPTASCKSGLRFLLQHHPERAFAPSRPQGRAGDFCAYSLDPETVSGYRLAETCGASLRRSLRLGSGDIGPKASTQVPANEKENDCPLLWRERCQLNRKAGSVCAHRLITLSSPQRTAVFPFSFGLGATRNRVQGNAPLFSWGESFVSPFSLSLLRYP
jgi:hypothetical protein